MAVTISCQPRLRYGKKFLNLIKHLKKFSEFGSLFLIRHSSTLSESEASQERELICSEGVQFNLEEKGGFGTKSLARGYLHFEFVWPKKHN